MVKRVWTLLLITSALLVPMPLWAGAAASPLTVSVVVSRSCAVETATIGSIPHLRLQCASGATRNLRTTGESYNADRSPRPAGLATTSIATPDARNGWRVLALNF